MSEQEKPQTSQDELSEENLENVAGGQFHWEVTRPIGTIWLPKDGKQPLPGGTGPTIPEPISMPDSPL